MRGAFAEALRTIARDEKQKRQFTLLLSMQSGTSAFA
jgi:hypothetical protein